MKDQDSHVMDAYSQSKDCHKGDAAALQKVLASGPGMEMETIGHAGILCSEDSEEPSSLLSEVSESN